MRLLLVWVLVLVTSIATSAIAQTSLRSFLPPETQRSLGPFGLHALDQIERGGIPRATLERLLRSKSAAPYLAASLPRIADLAGVAGMPELLERFASNGQGGAYEIAVAHAYRSNVRAVSSFLKGNELDGVLRSGTVIESKSAEPRRPDHLLLQLRRRAEGQQKVILALGYRPRPDFLQKLRALSNELGGRVEVHYIPLNGYTYEVLVEGRGIENPCNRLRAGRTQATTALAVEPQRVVSPRVDGWRQRPLRGWVSRALEAGRSRWQSRGLEPRSIFRASALSR